MSGQQPLSEIDFLIFLFPDSFNILSDYYRLEKKFQTKKNALKKCITISVVQI